VIACQGGAELTHLPARSVAGDEPSQTHFAIVSLDHVLKELRRRHGCESGRGNQNSGCEQQFTDHRALLLVVRSANPQAPAMFLRMFHCIVPQPRQWQ
jgi:hypothetical protein